jgi:hypothetical protein
MKLDQLNRWLTLAANLGVLLGIFLIIAELRQNARITQAQTRNDVSTELLDLLTPVYTDPQLADLLNRAEAGDDLNDVEAAQFRYRAQTMFRYWENVHYQYRVGLYDEAEFSNQEAAWRIFMTRQPYIELWCAQRATFSAEFVAAFDTLLPDQGC